jgi:hypothetical protein
VRVALLSRFILEWGIEGAEGALRNWTDFKDENCWVLAE